MTKIYKDSHWRTFRTSFGPSGSMGWQSRWAVEDHSRRQKTSQDDVLSKYVRIKFHQPTHVSQCLSVSHISSFLSMWAVERSFLNVGMVSFWYSHVTWLRYSMVSCQWTYQCRVDSVDHVDRSQVSGLSGSPAGPDRREEDRRRQERQRQALIEQNIEHHWTSSSMFKYVQVKHEKKPKNANCKPYEIFGYVLDMFEWRLTILIHTCTIIQIIQNIHIWSHIGLRWIGRPGACGVWRVGRVGRVGQEKRRREEEQREEERRREEPGTSPQRSTALHISQPISTNLNESQRISTNLPFKVVKVVKLSDFEFGYF